MDLKNVMDLDWNRTSTALLTALGHWPDDWCGARARPSRPICCLRGRARARAGGVARLYQLAAGRAVFIAALVAMAALTLATYLLSAKDDPGDNRRGGRAHGDGAGWLGGQRAPLAATLGVVVAILLQAKAPLQKIGREWISEKEIQDALLLGAAALVVMPLLPSEAIDPWGAVSPMMVWRIVVLVMAVGMVGHFAQRVTGGTLGAGHSPGFVRVLRLRQRQSPALGPASPSGPAPDPALCGSGAAGQFGLTAAVCGRGCHGVACPCCKPCNGALRGRCWACWR